MLGESIIKEWVDSRLDRYVILHSIDREMHWTAKMSAVMSRLDYSPKANLLARWDKEDAESLSMIQIITRHISQALLDDLDATIEAVESAAGLTSVKAESAEMFIGTNGTMAYIDKPAVHADLSEDRGEGWASW